MKKRQLIDEREVKISGNTSTDNDDSKNGKSSLSKKIKDKLNTDGEKLIIVSENDIRKEIKRLKNENITLKKRVDNLKSENNKLQKN